MASPFRFFRKHQKLFLAVAACMAMFVFVVADPLMSWLQKSSRGGRSGTSPVATWNGGSINLQQLARLTQRRHFVSQFLTRLQTFGASRIMSEGGTPLRPEVPNLMLPRDSTPESVQVGVVYTRVLAGLAQQAGMEIGDGVINHFLRETGLRKVSNREISDMLGEMGGGNGRANEAMLFSALQEMLLANYYRTSYSSVTRSLLPEQMWQEWRRLNERIAVQAAILPADRFVSEVPEPTETQLQQFYDQHKQQAGGIPVRVSLPDLPAIRSGELPSPQVGFQQLRRVKLHYLLGDVNNWTQKLLPTITDEEIVDDYDRNKRTLYVRIGSDTVEDTTDDSSEQPELPSSEPSADDQAEAAGAEAQPSDAEEASAEDQLSATGEDPHEYVPLEEVSDQIRRKLANDKAVLQLERLMQEKYTDLSSAYNKYGGIAAEAVSMNQPLPEPPAKLADLQSLAQDNDLIFEETPLLTFLELARESLVGPARNVHGELDLVVQSSFSVDENRYEPHLATDMDGNWYLVLKVEDIPSRVPNLEEIRTEVVAAWKLREAAQLARQQGEALAREAQESSRSLVNLSAEKGFEVVTTDLFSWLTFGTTAMQMQQFPTLGDAPPLSGVGPNLMSQLFDLKDDQVQALLNFDQSSVYVVRLDRRERTEEQLRDLYLSEAANWRGMQVMMAAHAQVSEQLLQEQIAARAGLELDPEWEVEIAQRSRRRGSTGF